MQRWLQIRAPKQLALSRYGSTGGQRGGGGLPNLAVCFGQLLSGGQPLRSDSGHASSHCALHLKSIREDEDEDDWPGGARGAGAARGPSGTLAGAVDRKFGGSRSCTPNTCPHGLPKGRSSAVRRTRVTCPRPVEDAAFMEVGFLFYSRRRRIFFGMWRIRTDFWSTIPVYPLKFTVGIFFSPLLFCAGCTKGCHEPNWFSVFF